MKQNAWNVIFIKSYRSWYFNSSQGHIYPRLPIWLEKAEIETWRETDNIYFLYNFLKNKSTFSKQILVYS